MLPTKYLNNKTLIITKQKIKYYIQRGEVMDYKELNFEKMQAIGAGSEVIV